MLDTYLYVGGKVINRGRELLFIPHTTLKCKSKAKRSSFSTHTSFLISRMSSCGNCDCADKTNCPKKGNTYGVEVIVTEKSYYDGASASGENDGKCKCGPNCTCTTCTCGH